MLSLLTLPEPLVAAVTMAMDRESPSGSVSFARMSTLIASPCSTLMVPSSVAVGGLFSTA